MKRLLRAFLGTCCFMGISLGTDAGKEDETPPFVSLKATAIYAKSHIPSIQRTAKHDYIKTYEQLVEGGGSLLDEEDHTLYQRLKKDQTAQVFTLLQNMLKSQNELPSSFNISDDFLASTPFCAPDPEQTPHGLNYLRAKGAFFMEELLETCPRDFIEEKDWDELTHLAWQQADLDADMSLEERSSYYRLLSKLYERGHQQRAPNTQMALELSSTAQYLSASPRNHIRLSETFFQKRQQEDALYLKNLFADSVQEISFLENLRKVAAPHLMPQILKRLEFIHRFGATTEKEEDGIPNLPKALTYKRELEALVPTPQKPRKEIHICMGFDDNYAPHAGVAIASMLYNANPETFYNIHVLVDPKRTVSEENQRYFESLKSIKDYNIEFQYFPDGLIPEPVTRHYATTRWPIIIFYKLFIPEVFKDLDKIFWLDADCVIPQDLGELWDTDMEDAHAAGVLQRKRNGDRFYAEVGLEMPLEKRCLFRAATLLFNNKKFNEDGFIPHLKAAVDHLDSVNYHWTEEAVLALTLHNMGSKFKGLDKKWCALLNEIENKQTRGVLQFYEDQKPWYQAGADQIWHENPKKIIPPFFRRYWSYRELTPWDQHKTVSPSRPLTEARPLRLENIKLKRKNKLLWLNIPLTGTKEVDQILIQHFDERYHLLEHNEQITEAHGNKYNLLHTHFYPFNTVPALAASAPKDFSLATILRHPVERLAAHLRFDKKSVLENRKWLSPELINAYKTTQINTAEGIGKILKLIQETDRFGFYSAYDNCITRHFLENKKAGSPLTQQDFELALETALKHVDYFIFKDTVESGLATLSVLEEPIKFDLDKLSPEQKRFQLVEQIPLENVDLYQELSEHTQWDLKLYDAIRAHHVCKFMAPIVVEPGYETLMLADIPLESLGSYMQTHEIKDKETLTNSLKEYFKDNQELLKEYLLRESILLKDVLS